MTGPVPQALADRSTPTVGTFFKSGSPAVAEALGYTPLDFLLVDRQHASPDLETIESVVRAADGVDLPVLVRLPGASLDLVTNLLDAGVQGLVVPQVDGPETVRAIVDETRYERRRSYASSTRAGRYGNRDREEYLEWARESIAVVAMIETRAGLESADAIAAVDGVTALMTGPADLALSLDVDPGDEEHRAAIDRVFDAADAAGVGVGEYVSDPSDLGADRDSPRTFAAYGSDVGLLSGHLDDVLPP